MRLSSLEVLMLKPDSINLAASFRQASVHVYHFVEAIQVELAHKAGHVAMFEVKRQDFLAEPLLVLDKKTAAILAPADQVVRRRSLCKCPKFADKSWDAVAVFHLSGLKAEVKKSFLPFVIVKIKLVPLL